MNKYIETIKLVVKAASYSPNNKFGSTDWNYHFIPVVEHSLALGKKFNADLEVLELAALLHDYAAIYDYALYKEHHIHGARLAKVELEKLSYPEDKIKHIQDCILNHRGSKENGHKTIESKILASADAMSHITEPADMFFLSFGIHKYKTREGSEWLKGKVNRSWNKIVLDEAREMVRPQYELFIKILDQAINK